MINKRIYSLMYLLFILCNVSTVFASGSNKKYAEENRDVPYYSATKVDPDISKGQHIAANYNNYFSNINSKYFTNNQAGANVGINSGNVGTTTGNTGAGYQYNLASSLSGQILSDASSVNPYANNQNAEAQVPNRTITPMPTNNNVSNYNNYYDQASSVQGKTSPDATIKIVESVRKYPSLIGGYNWVQSEDGRFKLKMIANNTVYYMTDGLYGLIEPDERGQVHTSYYYFDEQGIMYVGWLKDSKGNSYYFIESGDKNRGKMATGVQMIDGVRLIFSEDGILKGV